MHTITSSKCVYFRKSHTCFSLSLVFSEQVQKVVGYTAPADFIERVNSIAVTHDPRLLVDCTRAYYFGARYNVEMEVVLPGSMTVIGKHRQFT